MSIELKAGLTGFVASDPQTSRTSADKTRLYFLAGQEKFRFEEDGTRTNLESEFIPVVMFGKSADRAATQFRKGDNFVAHGELETYTPAGGGPDDARRSFHATSIGHNNNAATYTVDRSRQHRDPADRSSEERDGAQRNPAEADPLAQILDERETQLSPAPSTTPAAPAAAAPLAR